MTGGFWVGGLIECGVGGLLLCTEGESDCFVLLRRERVLLSGLVAEPAECFFAGGAANLGVFSGRESVRRPEREEQRVCLGGVTARVRKKAPRVCRPRENLRMAAPRSSLW